MNKWIYYFILSLLFGSCTDDTILSSGEKIEEGKPGIVILELSIPELTKKEIRTKATGEITSNEGEIEQIDVIVFNRAGEFQEKVTAGTTDISLNADGSKKVALKLTQIENCDLYVYANAGNLLSGDTFTKTNLANLTTVSSKNELASALTMGGKLEQVSISASTPLVVTLYLSVAKISVVNEVTLGETFSLSEVTLCEVADKGKVTTDNSTLFLPSDVNYTNNYTHNYNIPFYTYERKNTDASMAYLILKATYKGTESYYRVDFRSPNNEVMDLQRTHHYTVHIKRIEGAGYTTAKEAAKYPASNIVVEITDENLSIVNMITNGQYELGLCDTLSIEAEANSSKTAIISLKAISNFPLPSDIDINVESDYPNWLAVALPNGGGGETEKNYSCIISAKATNLTGKPRIGKVVFRAGNLRNTLIVVQNAADLITVRDISILDSDNIKQYSDFLSEIEGLSDNRNKGLHFSIFNNTYSYSLSFAGGDVSSINEWRDESSGKLTISQVDKNLNISLSTTSLESDPWISELIVTLNLIDGTTREETYPIYKTGIFIQEDGRYQVSSSPITGKFYYEVIKIDEDYWLDRNLGATSNGFYSYSTNTHEGQNINAVGGYYKIKENTTTENVLPVCPTGFTVPTQAQFTSLFDKNHLIVKRAYTNAGNAYWLPIITSTQTNAPPLKSVYLPMGGYMQNDEVKGNGGGYYWTSTFAYYGQGTNYGDLDPEQKYWQRRFNLLTNNPQFTSDRFVNGSNASNDAAYKGMSIRCIRSSSH